MKVTKSEYEALLETIRRHDEKYYEQAKPEITDYEYDQLLKELEAIEQDHPEWVVADSPTRTLGDAPTAGFKQVKHKHPMLSLSNTYSEEEVKGFIDRIHKLTGNEKSPLSCELKMDGVAVGITYINGRLKSGVTRGNGKVGDDITANVRKIASLPKELKGSDIPERLELRGEIFIPKKTFLALNTEREENGEEGWANPRNAAAGSLKLLDSEESGRRGLDIVLYNVAEETSGKLKKQSDTREFLKQFDLPVFAKEHVAVCHTEQEVMEFAHQIEKVRDDFPFEIDGIVIKLDQLSEHKFIGSTGKCPRWATAYKFAPEQAVTVVKEITTQVGRTGVITPVAELEPVLLAGSTIARATLHNQDEVKRKDIRAQDTVIIEKGGDVIPKVVRVDLSKRPDGSVAWEMDTHCPICGTPVERVPGQVAVRCPNRDTCGGQHLRRINFFVAKNAMDIDTLGEKIVAKLVEKGIIANFADIYAIRREDLEGLEGFKDKSINNLLDNIEKSKDVPLARLVFALGIPFVGTQTAELLAQEFGTLEALMEAPFEQFVTIEGVGPKVAESLVEFFATPRNQEEIKTLLERGVRPQKAEKVAASDHPFAGKTFVLTGTLEELTRSEATHLIKERGGKVSGSVSKKTDYVLAGEAAGAKYDKAQKLGVKILSEEEFKKAL